MESGSLPLLPSNPFFSCEETGFSVVDAAEIRTGLRAGGVVPKLILRVGPDNVFEHRPRRVVEKRGGVVVVECDEGVTVSLDFDAGTARKHTPAGEFLYCGDIDEGNDGQGYIPAR